MSGKENYSQVESVTTTVLLRLSLLKDN